MTKHFNAELLIRWNAEIETAKAKLAATGKDDPYFRAKAFFRACEGLPPLPERIT